MRILLRGTQMHTFVLPPLRELNVLRYRVDSNGSLTLAVGAVALCGGVLFFALSVFW